MVEPPSTPSGRAAATAATLLVKHIPDTVQPETLQRLLAHYGAAVVRPCSLGRLKNCAYVDFADEAAAVRAQAQLHRLRLLNKTLWVGRAPETEPKAELAGGSAAKAVVVSGARSSGPTPAPAPIAVQAAAAPPDASLELHAFPPPSSPRLAFQSPYLASPTELRSTASFNLRPVLRGPTPVPTMLPGSYAAKPPPPGEPIAPSLGVDYPFPPDLEYAYPPPDSNILSNITSALIAVLHLMNKMNLPAPFRPAVPTPPFPSAAPPPAPPSSPPLTAQAAPDLSDGESELESDEEVREGEGEDALTSGMRPRKKARVSVTSLPPLKDVAKPTSVIKKNAPVIQIKLGSKLAPAQRTGAGEETRAARKQNSELAVIEEIQKSKLSPEEILAMPMFKGPVGSLSTLGNDPKQRVNHLHVQNYSVGEPSDVLYIKNLAKDEGRMRGQAFVTFPALNLAQKALVATHGYLLKDKPMVVQYGRKPVTRKSDEGKK
eukprot:SM000026S08946  [mRNA]  locus=s26:670131:673915:- [translate_table: standard]